MKNKSIKIAMIGLGTVGSGVWKILTQQRQLLEQRIGVPIEIKWVAVKSPRKKRPLAIPKTCMVSQINSIFLDPEIQIVVELMGGVTEAKEHVLQALKHQKHVVTANKALIAECGSELFHAAREAKRDLCFEAAVGGGIPVLRALREGLAGNHLNSIYAIINGTSNFILTEMFQQQMDFSVALKKAQSLGFAEADPSFDIQGIDAAQKLAILIAMAYGVEIPAQNIHTEGIESVSLLDLQYAQRFGYQVKLLAIAKSQQGKIQARVHPTMIPENSMLAAVQAENNAVLFDGDFVGETLLYGKGAGSEPTASAVVGDIIEIARNIKAGVSEAVAPLGVNVESLRPARIEPMDMLKSEYYLRFQVTDRPGVLAKITQILSQLQISISSVYQHGHEAGGKVSVVVLTHLAKEKNLQKAIIKINQQSFVYAPTTLIRIED
ncbi:MAG: homoserine dehydrogenase [Deltaproteobacteria bacterium]|nr:homoserine dehydrogenase [Deltaproteobacteria bacterium]